MKNTQTIALAIRERSCQSNAMMRTSIKETYVRSSHFRAKELQFWKVYMKSLALYLSLSLSLVA